MAARRFATSPHATDLLLRGLRQGEISTYAIDASRVPASGRNEAVLDMQDRVTARFAEVADQTISDTSREGMAIRNQVMAHFTTQMLAPGKLIWLQVGTDHLFGNDSDGNRYEDSLAARLAPLAQQGKLHMMAVFNGYERKFMPMQADAFPGIVITHQGLDRRPASDLEEYSETGVLADRLHKASSAKAMPAVEYLSADRMSQRQKALAPQVGQWLARLDG